MAILMATISRLCGNMPTVDQSGGQQEANARHPTNTKKCLVELSGQQMFKTTQEIIFIGFYHSNVATLWVG